MENVRHDRNLSIEGKLRECNSFQDAYRFFGARKVLDCVIFYAFLLEHTEYPGVIYDGKFMCDMNKRTRNAILALRKIIGEYQYRIR
ncbi:MAG: hypothetical protein HY368_00790 [Candidatus Aenigmarchaeota archaeon]|nr:hypothetical protein [Candidatus Aenigmarchaeota archaeon]